MKKYQLFYLLFLTFSVFLFTACDDDDGGEPENPQELITTVKLTFMDGTNTVSFEASDPDGDGGNPPVVDTVKLTANTTYLISVEFLDESDPADVEDITAEIMGESATHLVCMTVTGDVPVPVTSDVDVNNDPLGLEHTLTTGEAGAGTLQVVLKHEPDKAGMAPCSTGETDAEVVFEVRVE